MENKLKTEAVRNVFIMLLIAALFATILVVAVPTKCPECNRKDAEIKHLKEQVAIRNDSLHKDCLWIK